MDGPVHIRNIPQYSCSRQPALHPLANGKFWLTWKFKSDSRFLFHFQYTTPKDMIETGLLGSSLIPWINILSASLNFPLSIKMIERKCSLLLVTKGKP